MNNKIAIADRIIISSVKGNHCRVFLLLSFLILFLLLPQIMYSQISDNIYKADKVADKVWRIIENNTVNIYLIEGKDSALILDTGYGSGDLKAYVKTITKLPLIVVNSHLHPDHAGNDLQFNKVYVHKGDSGLINGIFNKKANRSKTSSKTKDKKPADVKLNKISNVPSPVFIPVKEGHIFDLGGRKLEVIEVPGHTHGSICLLDSENKILFAGDHINAMVWLFLKESYPLNVYLETLQKVEKRINEYSTIMPGHNAPLDKAFIYELIACVKSILGGKCSSVPYNYAPMTAGSFLCKYKRSQVAYDPNNLFKSK